MTLFVAFEILGTIAFAVSGAVVAISKKMDIFGVAILGMTTAVGGGILRDLILGITPPAAFQSPGYALTSIAVSMLVFLPPVRRLLHWNEKLYDTALLLFDAIGLGIFTVIGVQTAYIATGELNAFLAIFVGVVTGCGGRITSVHFRQAFLRDRVPPRRRGVPPALEHRADARHAHRRRRYAHAAPACGALPLEPAEGEIR